MVNSLFLGPFLPQTFFIKLQKSFCVFVQSFFSNNLEIDTRLSNLENKVINISAVSGTTNITGSLITNKTSFTNVNELISKT